jgi:hypothetical protein
MGWDLKRATLLLYLICFRLPFHTVYPIGDSGLLRANEEWLAVNVVVAEVCVVGAFWDRPGLQEVAKRLEAFRDAKPRQKSSAAPMASSTAEDFELESWLSCPLSLCIMDDPVVAEDGFTYERRYIETHLRTRAVSPMTNLPMGSMLMANRTMRSMIAER